MNISLTQWAIRNRISAAALCELEAIFGLHGGHALSPLIKGTSESAVQSAVRLEAARKGVRLWRNNVGALMNDQGVPVRYGLANESKASNKVMKSGDLIGWRSMIVQPQHIGLRVAIFVSRECKPVGWRYTGTEREKAQLAWAELVLVAGGDAGFCCGEGTLDAAVITNDDIRNT